MKILDAKLNYYTPYCNAPQLEILVDIEPKYDELIYEEKHGLYLGVKDGFANFYYYTRPGDGYGGQRFDIKVKEGGEIIEKSLLGPWSSNAGAVNFFHNTAVVEVGMTWKRESFDRGYTFFSFAITLSKAQEALKFLQGVSLIKETTKNSITYIPVKSGLLRKDAEYTILHEGDLK